MSRPTPETSRERELYARSQERLLRETERERSVVRMRAAYDLGQRRKAQAAR